MSCVYFLTNNSEKLAEYQKLLDRYNIKAINDFSQMKKNHYLLPILIISNIRCAIDTNDNNN